MKEAICVQLAPESSQISHDGGHDHHIQEDHRWSPHVACPPKCIVDSTANTHAQHAFLSKLDTHGHLIHWDDTRILQCASWTMELISHNESNLHMKWHPRAHTSIVTLVLMYPTAGSPHTRRSEVEPTQATHIWLHHRFAHTHVQHRQLTMSHFSKPRHTCTCSYKLRPPMT